LRKKYEEIMDRIEVTPEMRQRVLANVQQAARSQRPKVIPLRWWKQYAALAACLAIVLIGTFVYPALRRTPGIEEPSDVQSVSPIEECANVEELAEKVGFSVSQPSGFPFEVKRVQFTSYFGELAQVEYSGADGESAVYRMSVGTEDNSGRYDSYDTVTDTEVSGLSVTLKGADGLYVLAIWTDGKYSYSLWLSQGVTEAAFAALIKGNL